MADLPADLVALYERIRESSGGMGAALLAAGRCGGCRLELSGADRARVTRRRPGRGGPLRGVPADHGPHRGVRACEPVARRRGWSVEADGGARGNPGPAGYGAVVRDADTGEVLAERSEALGVATNNVAEYRGLIAGLQAAAELGATEVEVRMDSKLVVEQMSGRWQIKHPGLRPLAAEAAGAGAPVRHGDRSSWIPRERNTARRRARQRRDGRRPPPVRTAVTGDRQTLRPGGSPRPRPGHRRVDSATDRPTRLILVRHGETAFTAQRRYSGRGDVPLSERGLAQATATARRVADARVRAGRGRGHARRCPGARAPPS